ncbi:MAG: hypothetical protein AAF658_05050, partial [Myxococcota bacterium]
RWRFHLGSTSSWGELHPWIYVRWWLSERWWLMPLGVLFSLLLLVPVLRDGLRQRVSDRLDLKDAEATT